MGAKKVCSITGSARGIGAACLRVFARHDYPVIALDVLPEGQQIADGINQQGRECLFLSCDVSDEN